MPRSSFADRLVVVTGGTGALGRAVVSAFLSSGAEVVVGQRRLPAAGEGLAGARYSSVDASDEQSVRALFEGLPRPPDVLANTVGGWAGGAPVSALDVSVLRAQLELNLVTAALLTKWAVRRMAEAGRGRIVHVSSRAAVQDGHGAFAYSASKLGVVRLVEAVAGEVRGQGIGINCVLPATLDTPQNRAAMPAADHSRWTPPEQIAQVICFLASDEAAAISGAAIPVYGRA